MFIYFHFFINKFNDIAPAVVFGDGGGGGDEGGGGDINIKILNYIIPIHNLKPHTA